MNPASVSTEELVTRIEQLGIETPDGDAVSATADIGAPVNLYATVIGLGLEDVQYDPDDFPGVVYTPETPDVTVAVLFADGTVFVHAPTPGAVETVVTEVTSRLEGLGLVKTDGTPPRIERAPSTVPVPAEYTGSEGWTARNLFDAAEETSESTDPDRTPDLTFAGTGSGYTDRFSVPGGMVFVDVEYDAGRSLDVTAVGETVPDARIKSFWGDAPVTHETFVEMARGDYILDVETDDQSATWRLDLYFSAPESVSLPYEAAERGDRVVGPIQYSGFIRIRATNYDDEPTTIGHFPTDLNGWQEVVWVDPADDEQGTTTEKILSTTGDSERYPWLVVESDGEWELTVTPHQ